jgi:putative transposase
LAAQRARTYHLGLPDRVCRSTLAEANAQRSYAVYEKLFYQILERCRSLTPKHKFRFHNPLYTWDATTIDLCLAMFPWARFRTAKGAIKLHTQFAHAGHLPDLIVITDGKGHDLSVAKHHFPLIPDSIYCYDRGYQDFAWFRRIDTMGAFFVTRLKGNVAYEVSGQHNPSKNKHVLLDVPIRRTRADDGPLPLRLIRYKDPESDRVFDFITNNTHLAASTIAAIYKARWQIEAFFKWLKQNLKIKTFLGTSKNAVMTQIWVAMIYYLLLAYLKYQTKCRFSLFYLHKLVQETLLEPLGLIDLVNLTPSRKALARGDPQLLFQF